MTTAGGSSRIPAPIEVRRGYTDCRFGQMHYLEGRPAPGQADALPALVLLHQNPSSSEEYDRLLRALCTDRRVVAFDTPGYGMSDSPPRPLSVDDYAAAFGDGIDAMGLCGRGLIDVFGYHSGAFLAVELALQRPDLIGRLALSGVPMRTPQECANRLAAARATPQPTEDGAGVLENSAALWAYVVTQRDPAVSLERAVSLFSEKNRPLHKAWWVYEGVWTYPARDRLSLITQPTLMAHPHDALLHPSRAAAKLVKQSLVVEFDDLDRDFLEVGAERLADALRCFFTPLPAASQTLMETSL